MIMMVSLGWQQHSLVFQTVTPQSGFPVKIIRGKNAKHIQALFKNWVSNSKISWWKCMVSNDSSHEHRGQNIAMNSRWCSKVDFFFNFVFMKDSESMYKKSWKFIMFE